MYFFFSTKTIYCNFLLIIFAGKFYYYYYTKVKTENRKKTDGKNSPRARYGRAKVSSIVLYRQIVPLTVSVGGTFVRLDRARNTSVRHAGTEHDDPDGTPRRNYA